MRNTIRPCAQTRLLAVAVLAFALAPAPSPAADVRGLTVELARVDSEVRTAYYRVLNHTAKAVFAFRLDFPQLQTGPSTPGVGRTFWPQAGEKPGETAGWPFGTYGEFLQAWRFSGDAPPQARLGAVIYTDATYEGDPAFVGSVANSCREQEQFLRLQAQALQEALQKFPASWEALAAAAASLRTHAAGIENAMGGRPHNLASRLRIQADDFERERASQEEWGADPPATLRKQLESLQRKWASLAAMVELLGRSRPAGMLP